MLATIKIYWHVFAAWLSHKHIYLDSATIYDTGYPREDRHWHYELCVCGATRVAANLTCPQWIKENIDE